MKQWILFVRDKLIRRFFFIDSCYFAFVCDTPVCPVDMLEPRHRRQLSIIAASRYAESFLSSDFPFVLFCRHWSDIHIDIDTR